MGDKVSGVLNLMEDNLPSVTTYIFQSLPWEQWWLAEHPAPVGLSGVEGTAANGIYTQKRKLIAAKKLRVKQREEQLRLESSNQDLERIHRDLSTCVADLTFEVYELKMQLLQY
jgi:hypothetical protein